MAKRFLSDDYWAGMRWAVEFLKSWSSRAETAPWDMCAEFQAMREKMTGDLLRGFQDAVFHYLQFSLEGMSPCLDSDVWLKELEDPEACGNG